MSSSTSISALNAALNQNTVIDLSDADTLKRIAALIATPPINSRVIKITPAVAQELLDLYNKKNRPKKRGQIKKYMAAMTAGDWPITGDTLKFSDKGLLRDGQNRLQACIDSGVAFTTHVVFGIPDDAFDLLDRGKNRDAADVLAIDGKVTYPGHVAAAIRVCDKLEHDPKSRVTLEPSYVRDIAKRIYIPGQIEDRVQEAREINKQTGHPVGMVSAILYFANKRDQRAATRFAAAWAARGEGRSPANQGSQLKAMIKALDQLQTQANGRIHDTVRMAWAVIAWNAFVNKRKITVAAFNWAPRDDFPHFDGLTFGWYVKP